MWANISFCIPSYIAEPVFCVPVLLHIFLVYFFIFAVPIAVLTSINRKWTDFERGRQRSYRFYRTPVLIWLSLNKSLKHFIYFPHPSNIFATQENGLSIYIFLFWTFFEILIFLIFSNTYSTQFFSRQWQLFATILKAVCELVPWYTIAKM